MRAWPALLLVPLAATATAAEKAERPAPRAAVAHLVYFTLKDGSPAASRSLSGMGKRAASGAYG